MKYQSFYDRAPICVQNIMASLYGYRARRRRFGGHYFEHLSFLKEFDRLSRQEQEEYQAVQLVKLLTHATENSGFYRELYSNIDVHSIKSVEDLKILPVVTKEQLRRNIDRIVTIDRSGAVESHTGGTTGKSLTVYFTRDDMCERMATLDHFKQKHGFVNLEMKRATFMGKHIVPQGQKCKVFWRYNAAVKQMVYSSFHHNAENIPYYIESLNRFKPDAIDGFFSSIYDIAAFAEAHDVKFAFKPVALFPTSETIVPAQREVIERVFGCKVRDQYASSEGAPFVYECTCGNLHYDLSTGVIENLDDTDEVVVTSFTTYGTPLIRYKIGDSMVFDDPAKVCPCGFNTPLIKRIEGRAADYLLATNGTRINLGNVSNIVKNLPNCVTSMQIVQNELTCLIVRLAVDRNRFNDRYQHAVRQEIQQKFGLDMTVKIEVLDHIPRESSGKHRLIVSKIDW